MASNESAKDRKRRKIREMRERYENMQSMMQEIQRNRSVARQRRDSVRLQLDHARTITQNVQGPAPSVQQQLALFDSDNASSAGNSFVSELSGGNESSLSVTASDSQDRSTIEESVNNPSSESPKEGRSPHCEAEKDNPDTTKEVTIHSNPDPVKTFSETAFVVLSSPDPNKSTSDTFKEESIHSNPGPDKDTPDTTKEETIHSNPGPGEATPDTTKEKIHSNPGPDRATPDTTKEKIHSNPGPDKATPDTTKEKIHSNPGPDKATPDTTKEKIRDNPGPDKVTPETTKEETIHSNPGPSDTTKDPGPDKATRDTTKEKIHSNPSPSNITKEVAIYSSPEPHKITSDSTKEETIHSNSGPAEITSDTTKEMIYGNPGSDETNSDGTATAHSNPSPKMTPPRPPKKMAHSNPGSSKTATKQLYYFPSHSTPDKTASTSTKEETSGPTFSGTNPDTTKEEILFHFYPGPEKKPRKNLKTPTEVPVLFSSDESQSSHFSTPKKSSEDQSVPTLVQSEPIPVPKHTGARRRDFSSSYPTSTKSLWPSDFNLATSSESAPSTEEFKSASCEYISAFQFRPSVPVSHSAMGVTDESKPTDTSTKKEGSTSESSWGAVGRVVPKKPWHSEDNIRKTMFAEKRAVRNLQFSTSENLDPATGSQSVKKLRQNFELEILKNTPSPKEQPKTKIQSHSLSDIQSSFQSAGAKRAVSTSRMEVEASVNRPETRTNEPVPDRGSLEPTSSSHTLPTRGEVPTVGARIQRLPISEYIAKARAYYEKMATDPKRPQRKFVQRLPTNKAVARAIRFDDVTTATSQQPKMDRKSQSPASSDDPAAESVPKSPNKEQPSAESVPKSPNQEQPSAESVPKSPNQEVPSAGNVPKSPNQE